MRRIVAIIGAGRRRRAGRLRPAAGGGGGGYEVRAIFDNGGFLVPGEEVRVAGANVGSASTRST